MTEREFALEVVQRLQQAGYTALWAGGCVRDELLGLTPDDYDVATDARPEQLRPLFKRRNEIGASFGVVQVIGPRDDRGGWLTVEVAAFRSDGTYTDGRRPDAVTFSSPEEDANRRDFTINGMFFDPVTGDLIDFVGGRADLDAKVLRAIGDPAARFTEDKLRILRAVRMATRFDLAIDPDTLAAARRMAAEIRVVSAERIAEELRKLLAHPNRARGVRLLREFGLVEPILPELVPTFTPPQGSAAPTGTLWDHLVKVVEELGRPTPPGPPSLGGKGGASSPVSSSPPLPGEGLGEGSSPNPPAPFPEKEGGEKPPPLSGEGVGGGVSFPLAFAALLHHVGRPTAEAIADRLKLSTAEKTRVAWLVEKHQYLADAPTMRLSKLKPILVHPGIRELLELHRADAIASGNDLAHVEFCEKMLRDTPPEELNPPPAVTGEDLIATGLKPGPEFKRLLDAVREAQLEGRVRTKEEGLELVRGLRAVPEGGPAPPPA